MTKNTKVSGNKTYYAHWLQIPKKPGITAKYSSVGEVKLTWKKAKGAKGYVIYRSTKKNSGFKKIKTITSSKTLSCVDSGLKNGKTYYYYVKAYAKSSGKTVYSSKSNVAKKKVVTALDIPKLNKVTGTIYNIDVSWAKVKNATEYWVYMQIGNGTPKLVKKVKGTSVVITGEDYDYAKTKCAVSVRAVYKKDGVMVKSKTDPQTFGR